jgi:predicted alternative tryptophan synthase beta-subunit
MIGDTPTSSSAAPAAAAISPAWPSPSSDKINGKEIEIYPVEPAACPTLTRAPFVYDHGDTAGYTPLLPMHSLGHTFVPPPIHAGGLRYHGMAPTVSQLVDEGLAHPQIGHPDRGLEAGHPVGPHRGHHPGPGNHPRPGLQVIKEARQGQGGRPRKGHRLQLERPRPAGPEYPKPKPMKSTP